MRAPGLLAAVILSCFGCGGSSAPVDPVIVGPPSRPAVPRVAAVAREPVEVSIQASKLGQSLRLDIAGVARGHGEGEAVEDPTRWQVSAESGGAALARMVNGPVRVDRQPVGDTYNNRWDIHVRFSVAFAIPQDAREVRVRVEPPGSEPVDLLIDSLD
jgi:hypothetical protein